MARRCGTEPLFIVIRTIAGPRPAYTHTRLRVRMVLLAHEGRSIGQIARTTHQSPETVRRWLHRFRRADCAGLLKALHTGRPPEVTSDLERLLRAWVFRSPRDFGIPRPTWTA